MNRRQKIIVSVTGIFLVLLLLVGLTYAYFLTRIIGNTNNKSISVTTANLVLTYGDGNGVLEVGEKIRPGNSIKFKTSTGATVNEKTFTVTNEGDATDYVVIVDNVNVTPEPFESNDFIYTLKCTSSDSNKCDGTTDSTFQFKNQSILVGNKIAAGVTHTYTLTMEYKETGENQSNDMGKTFTARINIEDITRLENPYEEGTLAYSIIENSLNATNGTKLMSKPLSRVASEVSLETEKVLSVTDDDYGTSYYFRGNVSDNYINYNGFCWRIVRIEGDGAVKLILEEKNTVCEDDDNFYGSWVAKICHYGNDSLSPDNPDYHTMANYLNPTHKSDTALKNVTESWYKKNNFNEDDLKEDTWCLGNVTDMYTTNHPYQLLTSSTVTRNDLISTLTPFYYESFTRFGDEGVDGEQYATLKCLNNNYASFKSYVASITADELIFAGAKQGSTNTNFYLLNSHQQSSELSFWTLTLGKYAGRADRTIILSNTGAVGNQTSNISETSSGVRNGARPSITLKAGIELSSDSGNGLRTNPYKIKVN